MKRMKRIQKIFKGYIITNILNKKQYVGITSKTVDHRWKVHLSDAKHTNSEYKSHLHNALNKYGENNFIIKLIATKNTWKEICNWEIKTIQKLNTKTPNGYNLTDGGEGALGIKRTEKFKKKASTNKIKYYKDPEKRKEQSIRLKKERNTPKFKKEQSIRSKSFWQNQDYKEKTIDGLQKRWKDPSMRKKHKKAIRKATIENPKWMKENTKKNKELATNPEWKNKVSEGLKKALSNPEKKKERVIRTKIYWKEGHPERRKHHAEVMSKMIRKNLQDPEYQKWRKENPPGGKPILYNHKYFRSMQEAANYFKVSRPKIDRDLLKKNPGCKRLDLNKKYNFEIIYK